MESYQESRRRRPVKKALDFWFLTGDKYAKFSSYICFLSCVNRIDSYQTTLSSPPLSIFYFDPVTVPSYTKPKSTSYTKSKFNENSRYRSG